MSIESLARPEIVAMRPYSSARKEAPGEGILLNANEAPWSLLDGSDGEAPLNRYPEPQPLALVERLADLYGVPPDQVLVTRGSDEGIDLLTRVFCRAGQDAILQSPPTFGMYKIAAQAQGADVVSIPRSAADGFRMQEQAILDALKADRRIKLVFLTSPNNPTGDVVREVFLETLLEQARDRAVVVVDEAYAEFCSQPSAASRIGGYPNLVVLRTLSKAWAAAGLRCGAVLAQPELLALLRRVIAPYPLPSPVTALALRMLQSDVLARQRQMLQDLAANKQTLLAALDGRPFVDELIAGEANFVMIRVEGATDLLAFCASRGVILRGFPADALLRRYIRISVGSAQDIDALAAVLDDWENQA
ncbi:MAG: histidinol-phosphate transaminase [Xanthomonadales bacterium]|nr:histidinol-phosphate transaminase [Xanthomonadales bacterium]